MIVGNSISLPIPDKSVNLIVTSPPYPMIEMWDDMFSKQDARIVEALRKKAGNQAFDLMHEILDSVWHECNRVLADNSFVVSAQ